MVRQRGRLERQIGDREESVVQILFVEPVGGADPNPAGWIHINRRAVDSLKISPAVAIQFLCPGIIMEQIETAGPAREADEAVVEIIECAVPAQLRTYREWHRIGP